MARHSPTLAIPESALPILRWSCPSKFSSSKYSFIRVSYLSRCAGPSRRAPKNTAGGFIAPSEAQTSDARHMDLRVTPDADSKGHSAVPGGPGHSWRSLPFDLDEQYPRVDRSR